MNIIQYNLTASISNKYNSDESVVIMPIGDQHCSRGALTNSFGWLNQGILASLAFTVLILKRFCEPKRERRPWTIWFYDTSKQGLGSMVIHFANLFLADVFQGDPCTWYIISFLLDSSVGLLIMFICIRACQNMGHRLGLDHLIFGDYGTPPKKEVWLVQCVIYILIMTIEKVLMTCLMQLPGWDHVRKLILAPIGDPKIEVALVVLVIPFFVNMFIFWVMDNFLMHHKPRRPAKLKVCHYTESTGCPETEVLLPGDESCQQRHPLT